MAIKENLKTEKRNNSCCEVGESNPGWERNERENLTEEPERLDE